MIVQNFTVSIGEILISYQYDKSIIAKGNEPFVAFLTPQYMPDGKSHIMNYVSVVDKIPSANIDVEMTASTIYWKMWTVSSGYHIEFFNNEGLLTSIVKSNNNFTVNKIIMLRDILNSTVFLPSDVHAFLLIGYFGFRDIGLFIHGSMIRYQDKGVIFSGISGSGKSTICALASEFLNQKIITDDRILVRFNDGVECYSTPYDWKIERCNNIKTHMGCIVYLKHGSSNWIRKLSYDEKMMKLFSTNLLPFFVPEGMLRIAKAFDLIVNSVPIIEYHFKPDRSAIEYLLLYLRQNTSCFGE
ncbi:MAG: hypothetical protein LBC83_00950 [Oscillospiraceae bacterium]|jgi:hypothetical protein|nr:hypothetical protein [Oscillospiraceae bacterium]